MQKVKAIGTIVYSDGDEEKDKKRVKYIGKEYEDFLIEHNRIDLIHGKEYKVVEETKNWYRVKDESGEVYAYPKCFFEVSNNEIDE